MERFGRILAPFGPLLELPRSILDASGGILEASSVSKVVWGGLRSHFEGLFKLQFDTKTVSESNNSWDGLRHGFGYDLQQLFERKHEGI